jgi:histidinol-phosphate aminotransferase
MDDAVAIWMSNGSGIAVAASYDADAQLRQRIRLITGERRYLRRRLAAMGIYSTDGHANFVYLPPAGRPWREVFEPDGLRVRHYADGGVRITVGARASTRAILAAVQKSVTLAAR